jgi:hypothetical protein
MIRHQVYFDTLGSMKEDSASWRSVFAGLSVLRLVDAYVEAGSGAPAVNWAQVHSVRAALENVAEGDPVRGVLTNVLEEALSRATVDDAVCVALLAYGRALDYEASWGLATDVFTTVARLVRPEKNARLAVEANVSVGGAARRNGDWDTSGRAYSQAAYIADTMGDRKGVLTVQVGIANNYMAKGNLPQAQVILDDVIVQAKEQDFKEIQGRALHSRAALSARKGENADGLKIAHEALELTSNGGERDLLLEDIAAMFMQLGLLDSARDAHLILLGTAQNKLARWSATMNLMELAGIDGKEDAFRAYARELASAPLGPWARSHYLLLLGEGLARFGHNEDADCALSEASLFANANQYHQVAFKAQNALTALKSATPSHAEFTPPPPYVVEEVGGVVRAISELRKTAAAAS